MKISTKCFGEIDIEEDKIVTFEHGIMGFESFRKFTLIFSIDGEEKSKIAWLQSVEEPGLALPVVNPFVVKEDYDPIIQDDLLIPLGDVTNENVVVLLVVTVPSDVSKTTANLKAPIIINSDTRLGAQIIVENEDYQIKYPVVRHHSEDKGDE